jgi:FkbM family methyltransferase
VLRPVDVLDWLALRSEVENAWEVVRFRQRGRKGEGTLEVRFRDGPPLLVRGGTSDFHMFHRIFLRDEYRTRGRLVPPLECVLDLGANVGVFSTFAARLSRRVIACEPLPANYEQLRRNVGRRPNVTTLQVAVSGEPGVLRMFRAGARKLSGTPSAFREASEYLSDEFDEVPATTLERVMAEQRVERCDLLKIDIEGSEYDVLHATSDAALARIARIHGEYHDVRPEDPRTRIDAFAAWLGTKGYRVEVAPHAVKPNFGMFFAARSSTTG